KNAIAAPKTCFKDPPTKPEKNMFEVGMKLEAVDIKHPSNICPATIKNVDNNMVEIHLDGWDQMNDFRCLYYSRSLFPVGWCKKTGHTLQFPAEYKHNNRDLWNDSFSSDSEAKISKMSEINEDVIFLARHSPIREKINSSIGKDHSSVDSSNFAKVDAVTPKNDSKKISLAKFKSNNFSVDSLLIKPDHSIDEEKNQSNHSEKSSNTISLKIDPILSSTSTTSSSPSIFTLVHNNSITTSPFPTMASETKNQSKKISNTEQRNMKNCPPTTFKLIKTISAKPNLSSPQNNSASNKSTQNKSNDINSTSLNTTLKINKQGSKRNFDQIDNDRKKQDAIKKQSPSSSSSTISSPKEKVKTYVNGKKSSSLEEFRTNLPSKMIVNSWTVDQLIDFLNIRFSEFNKYENQFRSQEIDGNAFLMLTNDLIMKFMNIKLGYSLKIIDLIDKINSQIC
ncbi:Sex comb on midleg-like protein 2, partial [Sarcoptes scabiei]